MSQALLDAEIARWLGAGIAPKLWWRDDDATDVSDALDRLTTMTGDKAVAVLLAVIPARATDRLANHVALYRHLSPCVHGFSHTNHEPSGVKRAELGTARPLDVVLADVAVAHERMQVLFGQHLAPVLVPPWNRMRADLAARLDEVGIAGFSTFGHRLLAPDRQANTHVDLMDWASHTGKPCALVLTELAAALAIARENGRYEIGILSHHLVHDDMAWQAAHALVALEGVKWVRCPLSTQHDHAPDAGQA